MGPTTETDIFITVIMSNSNINILVFRIYVYLVIKFKLSVVQYIKFNPQQKLTFLLWSSLAIVTSTSLSSADIFTSSSDFNYLLYSTSIEMLCLARQSQLALRVIKYIPLALHLINTYEMC